MMWSRGFSVWTPGLGEWHNQSGMITLKGYREGSEENAAEGRGITRKASAVVWGWDLVDKLGGAQGV